MSLDTHSGTGLGNINEGMEVGNDTANGDFPDNIDLSNSNIFDFDVEDHPSDSHS
ncbi:hypothetical protein FRC12_025044 [Ceratobasidium sp. 428]|nr:hypothetical protein FRC12_025044 [Ceratobasidium sp. 428]